MLFVFLYLLGGSETFQDKVNFFQRELRHIHSKKPRTKTCLKISRPSLLESVSKYGRSLLMGHMKQVSKKYKDLSSLNIHTHTNLSHLFLGIVYFFCVVQSQNFMGIKRDASPPFQSLKATRNFSVSDWSKNFEVVFQDEEGRFTD